MLCVTCSNLGDEADGGHYRKQGADYQDDSTRTYHLLHFPDHPLHQWVTKLLALLIWRSLGRSVPVTLMYRGATPQWIPEEKLDSWIKLTKQNTMWTAWVARNVVCDNPRLLELTLLCASDLTSNSASLKAFRISVIIWPTNFQKALTPFLLHLRFGLCWPFCAFTSYTN